MRYSYTLCDEEFVLGSNLPVITRINLCFDLLLFLGILKGVTMESKAYAHLTVAGVGLVSATDYYP